MIASSYDAGGSVVNLGRAQAVHVRVLLFGSLADHAPRVIPSLSLDAGASASDVAESLKRSYPALAAVLDGAAVAVNLAYVRRDRALEDGDEVAFIPPVSGG